VIARIFIEREKCLRADAFVCFAASAGASERFTALTENPSGGEKSESLIASLTRLAA
jgi:hypothetical protein